MLNVCDGDPPGKCRMSLNSAEGYENSERTDLSFSSCVTREGNLDQVEIAVASCRGRTQLLVTVRVPQASLPAPPPLHRPKPVPFRSHVTSAALLPGAPSSRP